jgi:hypothetical protein
MSLIASSLAIRGKVFNLCSYLVFLVQLLAVEVQIGKELLNLLLVLHLSEFFRVLPYLLVHVITSQE